MEKLFHLKEHGTNVKTEILAGITTFLAMAYILAVNPAILGQAHMSHQGVFSNCNLCRCRKHLYGINGKLPCFSCARNGG